MALIHKVAEYGPYLLVSGDIDQISGYVYKIFDISLMKTEAFQMIFMQIFSVSTIICIVCSTSCCNEISTNEILTHETLPNIPEDVANARQMLTENNISPNTTINISEISEQTSKNATLKIAQCTLDFGTEEVEIVNDTQLIRILAPNSNITSKDAPAHCVLVLFYSKYGTFSSMAAPHFNALPRAFPDIKMVAINAMMYHLFNTQNGIVGIPSLLLFHNGKPIAKFNDSEYTLDLFSKFLTRHTGIHAKEKSIVTSSDFAGPVTSSPSKDSDIFLPLSWLFVIFCAVYYFTKSSWWKWILETIQNNWRESEAQAEHLHAE